MRKLLALALVAVLSTSSFAYIPLSNSETNLGSFRNGATRGMFYEEIDALSVSPVTLMDFGGNNLYTNWGNLRYSNDPTAVVGGAKAGADRAFLYDASGRSQYFNMGLVGNPLSCFNLDNSRAGLVFQNFGSKSVAYNLDNSLLTGTGAGLESQGSWSTAVITDLNTAPGFDEIATMSSDTQYYDNVTNTQWDGGIAYKGLILSDLVLGFGLRSTGNSDIRTTGGSKTYNDVLVSTTGATNVGMPASATLLNAYSVDFASLNFDVNSAYMNDFLFQGRLPILGLQLEAGLGLRMQTNKNPDSVDSAGAITITGQEGVNTGATPGVNGTQAWDTGKVIVKRGDTSVVNVGVDFYDTNMSSGSIVGNIATRTGFFGLAGGGTNAGVTSVTDERKGTGPILRLEAVKEWAKVNLTGIFNYSTVKLDIGKEVISREYCQTSLTSVAATPIVDNFIATDFTQDAKWNGDETISNVDFGGKVEFKALEGIKLALGGFVQTYTDKAGGNQPVSSTELSSYSDGVAANDATNGYAIAAANKPFAGAGGEGSWSQTKSRIDTIDSESIVQQFSVPIGAEIKLAKKWTLGVGTKYIMTKMTTKESITTGETTTTTVQTPSNTAAAARTVVAYTAGSSNSSTRYSESDLVQYTYGVRFEVNPNLTLACNAFLDTAANGAPIGNAARASIFDLDTYRLLAIQAVFHF